jgi:outer membrane autotransporter protein
MKILKSIISLSIAILLNLAIVNKSFAGDPNNSIKMAITDAANALSLEAGLGAAFSGTAEQTNEATEQATPSARAGIFGVLFQSIFNSIQDYGPELDRLGAYININQGANLDLDTSMMYAQNNNPATAFDAQTFSIGDKKINSWVQYSQTNAKQKESSSYEGLDIDSKNFSFGLNSEIKKGLILNGSFAISQIDSKSTGVALRENEIDNYSLNIGVSKAITEKYYSNFNIGYTHSENSSSRTLTFANTIARADFDGQTFSASAGVGMINKINDFIVAPELNLNYANSSNDDYQETGAGAFNTSVSNEDINFLEAEIALNARHKGVNYGKIILVPSVRLGLGRDVIGDDSVTNFSFAGAPTQTFRVVSSRANQNTITSLISVDAYSEDSMRLKFGYLNTRRGKFNANTFLFNFGYQF